MTFSFIQFIYNCFSAIYYMDEVKNLASYARLRGVSLLPEFDAPGHAAYGWQKWPAEKGLVRN
jgi:N-acetyl-beta-hexosaminidase